MNRYILRSSAAALLFSCVVFILSSITISIADACTDDSWTAISTTNAPAGRDGQVAVWTGSEMIVWGGYNNGVLNTGGRYNPSTDSWMATNSINAPAGRDGHAAVWTGTQMIVWGGSGGGTSSLNTGGRYNPGSDSWSV